MPVVPKAHLRRHESFYLFDGNICLRSRGVVFRVFKSLLAEESEVFRNMFAIGVDEEDGQSTYDGVPLIDLDDDPDDLAQMFHFLWKPPLIEPEFGALCSCIRISTKYLMDNVLTWCLGRLRETVPYDSKHFQTSQTYYQSHPDHAALVIALARKCDLPQYIPPAFYFLACEESGCAIPVSGPYALSAEDVRRVYLGKRGIQKFWWDFIKRYDDMGLKNLRNSSYEWETSSPVILQIRTSVLEAGAQDPMKYWMSKKANSTKTSFDFKKDYAALCEKYGKKLFNDLPFIFDLDRKIKDLPQPARRDANQSV
ncbi:hypothetical protein M407DRAFT_34204 [Tulasnella calospora MUT 4182]|uniref:BTB domain-containing protein n=1 Tax=Tulasnella calospora MUT 4182 TaxID=1051891 RepID=A0A0C3K3Z9_9AGAM|nr:hypothetical protein M407DRAFT_34204 [Tulasnella calospora MUT 4182]